MSKIKSQPMTRTQIYIQPDLLLKAKIAAKRNNFNLSEYLRNLIIEDNSVENVKPNMKDIKITTFKIPGLKKGEKVNISGNHNVIYDYKLKK